jgi:hypothetical protein
MQSIVVGPPTAGRGLGVMSSPAWRRCLAGCGRAALTVMTAGTLVAAPSGAQAAGYTLLEGTDAALRADVAWLVDRRVLSLPLASWPLPERTLREAMARGRRDGLAEADVHALGRVAAALARAQWPARVFAEINTGAHPDLAAEGSVQGRFVSGVALQGGAGAAGGRLRLSMLDDPLGDGGAWIALDGSYAAVASDEAVLWGGVVDRQWGPGFFGSPVLSAAASPVPAVVLRRVADDAPSTSWLRWVGPWGYEVSIGQFQHYEPERALHTGIRLYARPLAGLELGFGGAVQWGGKGRPRGLDALWNALWGRTAEDDEREEDASNEIAGFDLRWSGLTAGGSPWVVYGHFVGEDVGRVLPLKYFGLVGAQVKAASPVGRLEWTIEATDTIYGGELDPVNDSGCSPAYRHDQYLDGYYHRRLPLGSTFGGGSQAVQVGLAWVPSAVGVVERLGLVASAARLNKCGAEPLHAAYAERGTLAALAVHTQGGGAGWRWTLGASVQDAPGQPRPLGSLLGRLEFRLQP